MTTLTIELPEPINQQLQDYGISQQKLQDLFANFIQTYLYQHQLLLSEKTLDGLTDDDLWQIVHTMVNQIDGTMQKIISVKQHQSGLSLVEEKQIQQLLDNYDRAVLIRAKAMALLKKRGHDLSSLHQPL